MKGVEANQGILQEFKYVLQPEGYVRNQFKVLRDLLENADEVTVATDAGREGELIARMILMHCRVPKGIPMMRLWTSGSLKRKSTVQKAMDNRMPLSEKDSLFWEGIARMQSDFVVGINYSRYCTLMDEDLEDGEVNSAGRVQSSTLNLVYTREQEINAFVPVPFWHTKAVFEGKGGEFTALWMDGKKNHKLFSQVNADKLMQMIGDIRQGKVVTRKVEPRSTRPPSLHSLETLQQEADKLYGYTAAHTLAIGQELYLKLGLISYIRSESDSLEEGEEGKETAIDRLTQIGRTDLLPAVETVGKRVFDNSRLTDHHGIIPELPFAV